MTARDDTITTLLQDDVVKALKKAISDSYGEDPKMSPDYGRMVSDRQFQ